MKRRKMRGQAERRGFKGLLFLLPSLTGVMIFFLVPYLDVIRRSFTRASTGGFAGVDNFSAVVGNGAFCLAAWNTFRFIFVCVPILVLLSLAAAVLIKNGLPGKEFYKKGLLIPMAVPAAAAALVWETVFHKNGFLNGFLHMAGINGPDWMNTDLAFGVLVFTYLWKNLGYSIIVWLAGLSAVPKEIYEAAYVDGAGDGMCFFRITVPNILPSFFMIAVLSVINSFKVFREAYLVAGDYPDQSIYMMQHLFNNWFRDMAVDKMSAAAVLSGGVVLLFIWSFWRLWERKEKDV